MTATHLVIRLGRAAARDAFAAGGTAEPDTSAWWALAATLRRYDLEIDAAAIDTFMRAYAGEWAALASAPAAGR